VNGWYAIFGISSTESGKLATQKWVFNSIGEVVEDRAERSTESHSISSYRGQEERSLIFPFGCKSTGFPKLASKSAFSRFQIGWEDDWIAGKKYEKKEDGSRLQTIEEGRKNRKRASRPNAKKHETNIRRWMAAMLWEGRHPLLSRAKMESRWGLVTSICTMTNRDPWSKKRRSVPSLALI